LSPVAYIHACTYPELPNTYALSLHDALPIFGITRETDFVGSAATKHGESLKRLKSSPEHIRVQKGKRVAHLAARDFEKSAARFRDRKSTRLNSSHGSISYAVFCLKKKTTITK